MKNLILVFVFCFLMTKTHGTELSVTNINDVESSQDIEFWYIEVGPKDK